MKHSRSLVVHALHAALHHRCHHARKQLCCQQKFLLHLIASICTKNSGSLLYIQMPDVDIIIGLLLHVFEEFVKFHPSGIYTL